MNFTFFSIHTVNLFIFWAALGAILFAVTPVLRYFWNKKKSKENPNCKLTFYDWYREGPNEVIYFLTKATGAVIYVFWFISLITCIYCYRDNQLNDQAYYEYAIVKAETLKSAIQISDDIINTELYKEVIEYNGKLSKIKTYFNNPAYKMTFSGECDWNAIDYIDLKEK